MSQEVPARLSRTQKNFHDHMAYGAMAFWRCPRIGLCCSTDASARPRVLPAGLACRSLRPPGSQRGAAAAMFARAALALAALLAAAACGAALTFDLTYGSRKCVSEDVTSLANVRGEVHVSGGVGDMSLDLFVSDPRGVVYFHRAGANAVKYSFKAGAFDERLTQAYRFCIVHQVHPNAAARTEVTRRVSLSMNVEGKGVQEEVAALAKRGDVVAAQEKFQDVYREVDNIISRMDELRNMEDALTAANESTSKVVMRVTFLAAVFTIGTGVLNFLNLKTFFKSKKLA